MGAGSKIRKYENGKDYEMQTVISFTIEQLFGWVLAFCGAVAAIGAAAVWISKAMAKLREPQSRQDDRLDKLEQRLNRHDELFTNDNRRLQRIAENQQDQEHQNRLMLKGMLALFDHAIDGNHIESLKAAQEETKDYLIGWKNPKNEGGNRNEC